MGLLDFLKVSPEKRVQRAKRYLDNGDAASARDELLGVDGPEAQAMRALALDALVTLNLDAAVSWAEAGDEERVRAHMELAAQHHESGREQDFKQTRRRIREIREAMRAELEAKAQAKIARQMQIDPLHMGGDLMPMGFDAELDGPDDEEQRARLALVVENYPDGLRGAVADLGGGFMRAVMDLEEGRPDLALQSLIALPDDQPLVRWERARAAYSLGDPASAARELRTFGNLAGGHHPIGRQHTGVFLAQTLAESGDAQGGLMVLRELRAQDKKIGGFLYAQLLAATDNLAEADTVLRDLSKQAPLEGAIYKLLAMVRVRGGHRLEAMRALEQGLHKNHCASGTCSARPPDPEMKRMLATLYLEDGIETQRALELLSEVHIEGQPSWDEAYVGALAAKAQGDAAAPRLIEQLRAQTPESDPRASRLEQYLPVAG